MKRDEAKGALMAFLRTIQRPDKRLDDVDESTSLVESGLIDSLAVIQIVDHLEETHDLDLRASGFDPEDLRSVQGILDLIERKSA